MTTHSIVVTTQIVTFKHILSKILFYFYSINYWPPSTSSKNMSDVVLLPNSDRLQQVEDYVRGCTTSIKFWPPSTSWKICQRLYYFYKILTAFSKSKHILEVVLLLPNSDRLQQVEKYVRGCTTSTKFWPHSASWKLLQRLYMIVEMSKTIYRFHKSVFDRSVSSVKRLYRATQNIEHILFNLLQDYY